jgi:predicted nucleic acid-binding Zn ribbon protein
MTKHYYRKPNAVCAVCYKPIYKRPYELERNQKRVYCSLACYGYSCRKEHLCPVCNKPILAHDDKKTCSRKCANINRSGIKYKLGKPRKDKVSTYKILKLRLFKSRGKICQRCGYNKFEILQIHHKDMNRSHNDLDNLELICPNCHYEEHYLEHSWLKID